MGTFLQSLYLMIAASIIAFAVAVTDPNHRLNSPFTPKSYSIALTPYFETGDEKAFTFDGEVSIVVSTESDNVNQIKMHSQDLNFNASDISVTGPNVIIQLSPVNPLVFNETYDFVYINLETALQSGVEYTIAITYSAALRNDLVGFYKSSYLENGTTKWLGATQLESTHARKVFPCFDEPSYKATFTLTINRPANYSPSLANTKMQSSELLSNGLVREVFYPTPVMSTYLVAFLVSEFEAGEHNDTREFSIYSRKEATNQSKYAFEFGQKVVDALGDYFGIDYYSVDKNLKLDHIALPDFRAGAMENWGLIKYREGSLLFDEDNSAPYYIYRIAQIIAHETTHMWFGDLVTCHWWSNTWLNEGFANYFQDYITSLIDPDIGSGNVLATGSSYAAYEADEIQNPAALTNDDVNSPEEISGHFGTITYQKGGSVIKMVHHLLGDATFRQGLHVYLDTNRHKVGYPDLMYSALELAVATTKSLDAYPGINITHLMGSWVSQPGHPILDVQVDNGIVKLTQRRFYANASHSSDNLYMIPITYAIEDAPYFNNTKPAFIMTEKTHQMNLSAELHSGEWILFNIQETGFYRVNYDTPSWQSIGKALKGNQRSSVHHLNRAKVVNDLFAFLEADVVDFDILYEVLEFLHVEDNYSVWLAALNGLGDLRKKYFATSLLDDIDSYILHFLKDIISKLTFTESATDSYETIVNRLQILSMACKLGHQECIDFATKHFKNFIENDVPVPPSFRPVVYCYGLKYGTAEDFDILWNRMLTTNVANEASVIQTALGCTKDEQKLIMYLQSVVDTSLIRAQDSTYPWSSVLADHNNAELAFNVLKNNYTSLSTAFASMNSIISYVVNAMHTEAQFEQFTAWISSCQECDEGVKESAMSTLHGAMGSAAWAADHMTDIQHSLRSSANIASISALTLICVFVAYFFKFSF